MGKITSIEWTDHTWNPWWGCTDVSPGCKWCYAKFESKRRGFEIWNGETGGTQNVEAQPYRWLSDDNWRKPLRWNREAERAGKPKFLFCASMADLFLHDPLLVEPRARVWELIEQTPWLTWQLLTKRPENIRRMLPWAEAPENVWLGCSIETARYAGRVKKLTQTPAPVHFLSCEPLLGSLFNDPEWPEWKLGLTDIEWVIAGGESGVHHRGMDLEHVRELRDACQAEHVPFFLKQIGGRWPKENGKTLDRRQWCERPRPTVPTPASTLF